MREIEDQDVLEVRHSPLAQAGELRAVGGQGRAHQRLLEELGEAFLRPREEAIGDRLASVLGEVDVVLDQIPSSRRPLKDLCH